MVSNRPCESDRAGIIGVLINQADRLLHESSLLSQNHDKACCASLAWELPSFTNEPFLAERLLGAEREMEVGDEASWNQ